ncbi:MAG: tRNA (cytidine(34)-2'-O)-methyltransferase [Minwuia sp.]|nr:tRNA (cytidine(34)-2'-O)-methyltransferase [Minwuia sp.]
MRLAMFQPDIPQNLGATIRLCACLGTGLDVIRPAAFPLDDRDLRRTAMDYTDRADIVLHAGWAAFLDTRRGARLILCTTRGAESLHDFAFRPSDILVMGRESAGVPDEVHDGVDARIIVPMVAGARSLNVAMAAAMALGEATRQLGLPQLGD